MKTISIRAVSLLFCAIVLFVLRPNPSFAQWSDANGPYVGPYDGYCNSLVTFGSSVFAATQYGVYRSTDGGHSWATYGSGLSDSNVLQLNVLGKTMFAATQTNAFRSLDSGLSWQPTELFAQAAGDQFLYAIGMNGIYRSLDNGDQWSFVFGSTAHLLAATGQYVFAGGANDLSMRSTDRGMTWDTLSYKNTWGTVGLVAASGSVVCIGTKRDEPQQQDPGGFFRVSTDYGKTWNEDTYFDQSVWNYPAFVVIQPGSVIMATNDGVFRTTDYINWTEIDHNLPNAYSGSIPITAMTQLGATTIVSVWGNNIGYGIHGLTLPDTNWVNLAPHSSDIPDDDRVMSALAGSGNTLVALSINGNVYRTNDSGEHWTYLSTLSIKGDTSYSSMFFLNGKLFAGTDSGVAISSDNGESWKIHSLGGSSAIASYVNNGAILFGGQGLYVSTDMGDSWTPLLGRPPGDIRSLTMLGTNIFAATQDGLFESTDNGTHWDQVQVGVGVYPPTVHSVFADGKNLLVGMNQIFLSTDGGATWTNPTMYVSNGARDVDTYVKIGGVTIAGLQYYSLDYSYDDGITWQNDTSIYQQFVGSIAADSAHVYFASNNGVFRHTPFAAHLNSVSTTPAVHDLQIYPNPTTGVMTISNISAEIASLSIYNVLGEKVMEIPVAQGSIRVDMSSLPSGVYSVLIKGASYRVVKM